MKMPRFVREYANYTVKRAEENPYIKPELKSHIRGCCACAVHYCERGMISPDEALREMMKSWEWEE